MVVVLPDMLTLLTTSAEFSPTEYKEAKLDPISQFSTPITVCLGSVFVYSDGLSHLLNFTPNVSTFRCHTILQSHMNKDHADDTKLIVQHSTTVKASTCILM